MIRVDLPTSVEVSFDERGRPAVSAFSWDGTRLSVLSQGRSWMDEEGRHLLVMVVAERIFELLLRRSDLTWRVVGHSPHEYLA